jgi:hypothetical protein
MQFMYLSNSPKPQTQIIQLPVTITIAENVFSGAEKWVIAHGVVFKKFIHMQCQSMISASLVE